MTEAEWLASEDPQRMLGFVENHTSERKARLFAVACCRRVWPALNHAHIRAAVEVAERFADGQASARQRDRRHTQAMGVHWSAQESPTGAQAAYNCVAPTGREAAIMSSYCVAQGAASERPVLAALLRCILGNPFHQATFPPALHAWEDGTLARMAQAIYEERAFDRLPILADALEEAGAEAALVAHLREPGPHARGCWVVDLILGKH